MDRPLQVGDLVIVVRPRHCCPERTRYGVIFTITAIHADPIRCCYCGTLHPSGTPFARWEGGAGGTELDRLKRIPPLGDERIDIAERRKELVFVNR